MFDYETEKEIAIFSLEVIKEMIDSTCGELVNAFRDSLLGMGFHPDNVNEYIEPE